MGLTKQLCGTLPIGINTFVNYTKNVRHKNGILGKRVSVSDLGN